MDLAIMLAKVFVSIWAFVILLPLLGNWLLPGRLNNGGFREHPVTSRPLPPKPG